MSTDQTPPTADELLRHADFLRAVALGILGDSHLADDVVQDTWTAALERPPLRPGNLRGWLAAVTRNLSRLSLRRKARLARREAGWPGLREVASPSEIAARVEIQQRLVSELARLEEPYRAVLFHRYCDGLSPKEIAHRTGESRGAIRTRLSRAHARLRERLDEDPAGRGKSRSLLPLLLFPRGGASRPPIAAGLTTVLAPGALLMAKKIAILSVAVLGVGLALFLSGRDGPDAPPDRAGEARPEVIPDVTPGEEEARAEPAPRGGGSIRGKVTLDGEPAEARVEIRPRDASLDWGSMLASPDSGEPLAVTRTDEAGEFMFDGLEPRPFDLVAYGAGGTWGRARGFCSPITPNSVSNIRLTGGRDTLAGKAEYRDGRPFRGVARAWTGPWFSSGTWSRAVETDEVGRFRSEDLPAGKSGVAFLVPGETLSIFWGVEIPVSGEKLFIVDGGLTEFAGKVIADDTEEPVAEAEVMYRGGQKQAREVVARTRTTDGPKRAAAFRIASCMESARAEPGASAARSRRLRNPTNGRVCMAFLPRDRA